MIISPLAKQIALLAEEFELPIVLYAHTKGDVTGPEFSMEDIRQKKTITLISEFCYLIHRFKSTNMNSFIQTRKHRGYNVKNYFHEIILNRELNLIANYIPSTLGQYKTKLKQYRDIGKNES